MKGNHYQRRAASAGGGTTNVPFFAFVQPNLYVGETVAVLFSAGVNMAGRGIGAVKRWKWERATRKALRSLDDRTLADIGVARSQIDTVARESARNPTYKPSRRAR